MFSTFLSLLPILNPFGSIPLFLALTKGFSKQERLSIVFSECVCVFVLMLCFFFGGSSILNALQISPLAIQATGGLMLLKVGFQMNFPQPNGLAGSFGLKPGQRPFLIPLAMPMLVGAGLITRLIQLSQNSSAFGENLMVIFLLTVFSGFILALGECVLKILGDKGLDILERLMGLLLIMISCEMLTGVLTAVFKAALTA